MLAKQKYLFSVSITPIQVTKNLENTPYSFGHHQVKLCSCLIILSQNFPYTLLGKMNIFNHLQYMGDTSIYTYKLLRTLCIVFNFLMYIQHEINNYSTKIIDLSELFVFMLPNTYCYRNTIVQILVIKIFENSFSLFPKL